MLVPRKKLSSPPGPRGHFLFGNNEVIADPLLFMRSTIRDYPGVASVRLLNQRAWLITDPSVVETVLVSQANRFRKHWAVRTLPIALGNGLLTSEGDFYARQRRLIQPAFQRARVQLYFESFIEQTKNIFREWDSNNQRDILTDMHMLTLNTASQTLFGSIAGDDSQRVRNALRVGQGEFVKRITSIIRLPLSVPTPSNQRLKRAASELDSIIYRFIRTRRESERSHNDLLSVLLKAHDEVDNTGMSDEQLRDECLTIFLAGQETSALALSWCWYLLSRNPESANRIYDEVDSVLQGRIPTFHDMTQLKETENALMEAMRMYPPIYVIGREPLEDVTICGYQCPKGTSLLIPIWGLHYDERYFPEPESFRPERWRDDYAKTIPKGAYFPFSRGPRTCPGSNFAMTQMKLVIAMIAQRYRFILKSSEPVAAFAQVTLQPYPGLSTEIQCR